MILKNASLRNLYWSFNKLYEYRNIVLLTMNWLVKSLEKPNKDILDSCKEYERYCEDYKKMRNLLLKYQQTHDKNIIIRIYDKLDPQYEHEKSALSKLLDKAFPLYVKQKAYDNYLC